jgi:L-threonylcarbamoyladenylate synthase
LIKTRFIRIEPVGKNTVPVRAIAAALLEDAVAAYPTETFYALGAAAFSKRAVDKVYRLKKRDAGKPLSVIASDLDMVGEISASLPPAFRALAGKFWPGPMTLVLPAAARFPDFMLGPGRTIAVRIPPLPWLRALVGEIGQPLTATSANLSGEKELADPAEVSAVFRGKIDMIVDGGPAPGGAPSTIVDLTSSEPRILRLGKISEVRIRAALRS